MSLVETELAYLQQSDQWANGDALYEDCEVDHGKGGRDEHLSVWSHLLGDGKHKGKGHSASQAAVHHDELLQPVQLFDPEPVSDGDQQEDPEHPEDQAAGDGAGDERPVPLVDVVDGEYSQEEEYHHFSAVGDHVSRTSHCCARAFRDVPLHVVLHGDATKGDAEDA